METRKQELMSIRKSLHSARKCLRNNNKKLHRNNQNKIQLIFSDLLYERAYRMPSKLDFKHMHINTHTHTWSFHHEISESQRYRENTQSFSGPRHGDRDTYKYQDAELPAPSEIVRNARG